MQANARSAPSDSTPSLVLGRKLDSIPFSGYHLMIILVLGLVAFVDGYDLAMTGSLLVLAKAPLHMTPAETRFLAVAANITVVIGGFMAAAVSDHWSRRTFILIGVAAINLFTLLITVVQSAEQLIVIRLLTGLAGGFAGAAPFPIAAELMPAQHRRTYGAIYEIMLASTFTVLPFVGFLLAGNPAAFRLMALPATLGLFVIPVLVYLLIPESPRLHLRRGNLQAAVDVVNRIISRGGNRVPPLTVGDIGTHHPAGRPEPLPPFTALFRRGQLRWTVVGILCLICAQVSYFAISVLLPKALIDQGAAVTMSFGLSSVVFMASIPGKAFTGFIMEVIGRRWAITYCLGGSLPGLLLMATAHLAGKNSTVVFVAGALITGFTVLSTFPAVRVYLSEQFPTALRGRGHYFGEAGARVFAAVLAPYMLEPYTGSATIFFGTLLIVALIGAFVPVLFGRETTGQLEAVTESRTEAVTESRTG
ncbi:MAG: MFS transporter [Alphaproteobacteria bacterium]|nr:MFS transporter [Alphaproteobacteria bacterium]